MASIPTSIPPTVTQGITPVEIPKECGICIETFNKTVRKPVSCPFCPKEDMTHMCLTCVKTCLLQDDAHAPRCPACRSGWSEDFLTQTFPRTWLLKEYKARREKVLLDIEKARLPEAQEDAHRYRRALHILNPIHKQIEEIREQIKALPENEAEKLAYKAYLAAQSEVEKSRQNDRSEIVRLWDVEEKARIAVNAPSEKNNDEYMAWCAHQMTLPPTPEYTTYMEAHENRLKYLKKQLDIIDKLREIVKVKWATFLNARDAMRIAHKPFLTRITKLQSKEYKAAKRIYNNFGAIIQNARDAGEVREAGEAEAGGAEAGAGGPARGAGEASNKTQWSFVMKCSQSGCEGFVGFNWACGLCEKPYCKECGDAKHTTDHICDPDTLSTYKALRKEAKPCPKCASQISKIDGCDQMWCTVCKTAFSWRTGEIETIHIHNPHYFQWMRMNGNALPERPVGDCLNLGVTETLEQVIFYNRQRRHTAIVEWARIMRHELHVLRLHRQTLRDKQDDEWKRQLRVKRLVNEITDDIWKDKLQRGEKAAQKEYAIIQIMELYTQAGIDLLRSSLPDDADIPSISSQIESLRVFCNSELEKVAKRFNSGVDLLNANSAISRR